MSSISDRFIFLYFFVNSGGKDLSGNKRTNKTQSFDQKFDKSNEALRVSCKKVYLVRVVRSHKEKRSAYAPEQGVRYDGIYRIEKCWRKPGIQVCRYLFVRCDNDPAPWTRSASLS
uniref:Putative SRA-YDG, PUA-like domain protein n=1 Tax=Helianthus annuus TaxID=4232 RepID=A0A251SEJ0_HELAN